MQNVGEVHATPENRSFVVTFWLATMDQLVPFHCSASVDDKPPTAMQNVEETHETPPREIVLGLETTDHVGARVCADAGVLSRATGNEANAVMSSPTPVALSGNFIRPPHFPLACRTARPGSCSLYNARWLAASRAEMLNDRALFMPTTTARDANRTSSRGGPVVPFPDTVRTAIAGSGHPHRTSPNTPQATRDHRLRAPGWPSWTEQDCR